MIKELCVNLAAVQKVFVQYPPTHAVSQAAQALQIALLQQALTVLNPDLAVKDPKRLTSEEQNAVREQYGKIKTIKMVRERSGCGLLEAKNAVEDWMEKNLGYRQYPN